MTAVDIDVPPGRAHKTRPGLGLSWPSRSAEALQDIFVRRPLAALAVSQDDTSPLQLPQDDTALGAWRDGLLPTCHLLAACALLLRRYPVFLPQPAADDPHTFMVRSFARNAAGSGWIPTWQSVRAQTRRALGCLRLDPSGPTRALSAVMRAYQRAHRGRVFRPQDPAETLSWLTGCAAQSFGRAAAFASAAASTPADGHAWLRELLALHAQGEVIILNSRAARAYAVLDVTATHVRVLRTRQRRNAETVLLDAAGLASGFAGITTTLGLATAHEVWNSQDLTMPQSLHKGSTHE